MEAILTRDQLYTQLYTSTAIITTSEDPVMERKIVFNEQFQTTLRHISSGLIITARINLRDNKKESYKYWFTPGSYKWKDTFLTRHVEELLGPKAGAAGIVKAWFENAFPGFTIRVIDWGDWTYTVEFDLS